MSYADELRKPEWKQLRKKILLLSEHKCKKCFNKRFQENLEAGIIFSKNFDLSNRRSSNEGNKFRGNVYSLIGEEVYDVGLPNLDFNKTYLVFYKEENFSALICGIKNIDGSKIVKSKQWLNFIKSGNKELVTESSYAELIKPINNSDTWVYTPGVHIHHTYYQDGLHCWEYPLDSLIAYCCFCHEDIHASQKIPRRNNLGIEYSELTLCSRCSGAGEFPEYRHVQDGICFKCKGAMYEELIDNS